MNKSPIEKNKRIMASIVLDPETIGYIDELSKKEERTRSAMIRTLIKEHKRTHSPQVAVAG